MQIAAAAFVRGSLSVSAGANQLAAVLPNKGVDNVTGCRLCGASMLA